MQVHNSCQTVSSSIPISVKNAACEGQAYTDMSKENHLYGDTSLQMPEGLSLPHELGGACPEGYDSRPLTKVVPH